MKEGLKDLLGRWLFSNDSKQFNIEASEINTIHLIIFKTIQRRPDEWLIIHLKYLI